MNVLALSFLLLQAPVDVEVRGNRLVPAETVLFYADLPEAPSQEDVERAFQRLWETGLFEDLRIEREESPSGLRLVIHVEEKPLLRNVSIRGERIPEEALRQGLRREGFPMEEGRPLGEDDALAMARAAERLLGPEYDVEARLEPVSETEVDLVLEATREPLPRVASIRFRGNDLLADEELRDAMRLEPTSFFSKWTRRNRFTPQALAEDLERLRALYRSLGYARASVGPPDVRTLPDGNLSIEIPIVEGERYRFGEIDVEPGPLLTEATARSFLPASGSRFDGAAIEEATKRLEDYYLARGYPLVRIDRGEKPVPDTDRIDVALRVLAGPSYRVGSIVFHGNHRYREQDLRQFVELTEAERLSAFELERTVEMLMSLGGFSEVRPEVDLEAAPGTADVHIHVEEKPIFEYLVGGSLDGVQGGSGTGQLIARGLLRRSETIALELDLGNRFQNFGASYRDVSTLGRRLFLVGDFRRASLDFPDETGEEVLDASLRTGGPIGSPRQFLASFRYGEFTLSSSLDEEVPFLTPFLGMRFHTYRSAFALFGDTRTSQDRPAFSSRGRRWSVGYELVAGDLELHRLRLAASQLLSLERASRHLVALSGRVETVHPFGETVDSGIPRFERLFLGSENDLRGFPIRGVGPRADSIVVGGDRLFFASAEYLFSPWPRVRLVGFVDLGGVTATDFEGDEVPDVRYDAGGELRVLVPLGNVPVRVGYGVNLDPLPDEPRGRFFVSLALRF